MELSINMRPGRLFHMMIQSWAEHLHPRGTVHGAVMGDDAVIACHGGHRNQGAGDARSRSWADSRPAH
jgi:hypothetical protein